MLGPFDRVLAFIGIGGYYLHKDYVWDGRYEIEGPYDHPVNTYGENTPYGMTFESVYHLRKPKGEITTPTSFKEIK